MKRIKYDKRLIFVAVVILLGIVFSAMGGDERKEAEGEEETAVTAAAERQNVEIIVTAKPKDTAAPEPTTEIKEPKPTAERTPSSEISYDALQRILISMDGDYTEADLLKDIEFYDLAYATWAGNNNYKSYIVAYEEEVAQYSLAETGDYIMIVFEGEPQEITYIGYVTYSGNSGLAVVLYNDSQSGYLYSYTDYSSSPVFKADCSESGMEKTNYWEAESLEDALISALRM